jgi:hypothetical protein
MVKVYIVFGSVSQQKYVVELAGGEPCMTRSGSSRIQFLEWTGTDHLRHTKFVALRDDTRLERNRSGLGSRGRDLDVESQVLQAVDERGETVRSMEHRAGWDATFSAPKSVSLTALVGGDERIREQTQRSIECSAITIAGVRDSRER